MGWSLGYNNVAFNTLGSRQNGLYFVDDIPNMFPRSIYQYTSIASDYGLVPNKRQGIICPKVA